MFSVAMAEVQSYMSGHEVYSVYMCNCCHTVLSDGKVLCGHSVDLDVIAFLRVTEDVELNDNLEFGIQEKLEACSFNRLTCKNCGTMVGFNLYSATRPYTHLRGLFCLLKGNLLCYLPKYKVSVEAKLLHFDFTNLAGHFNELKTHLVDLHTRVNILLQNTSLLQEEP